MKILRRGMALILALTMVWSLGASVWADELTKDEVPAAQSETVAPVPEMEEVVPEAEAEEEAAGAPEAAEAPEAEEEPAKATEAVQAPEGDTASRQEKPSEKKEGEAGGLWINPLYEDEEDVHKLKEELRELEEENTLTAQSSGKTYTKIKDAGKALRAGMKKRSKTIKLTFRTKKYGYSTLANKLYDEAMKHTGKPTEGDYLAAQYGGGSWKVKYKYSKGKWTYKYQFYNKFYTSAKQEKTMDSKVKSVMKKLNLKKDSDYVKVRKIYDYVTKNVTYDDAGLAKGENLCHSAYKALVKKTAVCQGYAVLIYRLCLEAGVPARYISGYGYDANGNREPHGWNIVKVKGKYYNVDATWDAALRQANMPYEYFLRSDATFHKDHSRGSDWSTNAFYKAHPMSSKDGSFHYWNTKYTVDVQPTCTEPGSKSIHCKDCDKKKDVKEVPALGHEWVTDEEHIRDLGEGKTERFAAQYFCSRCGIYDPIWYYYDENGDYVRDGSEELEVQSQRAAELAHLNQFKRPA